MCGPTPPETITLTLMVERGWNSGGRGQLRKLKLPGAPPQGGGGSRREPQINSVVYAGRFVGNNERCFSVWFQQPDFLTPPHRRRSFPSELATALGVASGR